ncbi:MAG: hypothetical protein K2I91_06520, partial [Muribaculaceae bacterium]|nr:hypothetical protein [Muribaculaceae bacterium]
MLKILTKTFACTAICAMSLSASAAVIPAESAIEMGTPSQSVVTRSTCYGAVLGHPFGMAAVTVKCAKNVTVNTASTEKVSLYYGDTLLKSIGTAEDEDAGCGIIPAGVGGLDDQGLIEWGVQNEWMIVFNFMAPAEYWQYGDYRIEIPEGIFILGDDVVGAMTLNYEFVDESAETLGYTVTPEAGTEFTPENPIKSVTLTVTGTQKIIYDWAEKPGSWSGLYNP